MLCSAARDQYLSRCFLLHVLRLRKDFVKFHTRLFEQIDAEHNFVGPVANICVKTPSTDLAFLSPPLPLPSPSPY